MISSIRQWANTVKTYSARHSGGQTLVLTALMLTTFIGFVGLAADTGYFFDYRRRMTAAADDAAVAGAMEVDRNSISTQVVAVAQAAAAANGFTHGTNNITVTVNHPPTSGYNVGNNKYVEVLINRPTPTFFLRALNIVTATLGARAVSGPGPSYGCIQTLNPSSSGVLVESGPANLNLPTCDVIVNSTSSAGVSLSGSACLNVRSLIVSGNQISNSSSCPSPPVITNVPPASDPFADLQAPTIGSCDHSNAYTVSGGTDTLYPGVYCHGIVISGGATVTFKPGLYILQNQTSNLISSSTASGTGVTFYIDSGKAVVSGGGSVVMLSAPTSGTWESILFFQNRSDANKATFSGGATLGLEGSLYFPHAEVDFTGGTTNTTSAAYAAYTVIVADTLKFTGASALSSDYAKLAGGSPIKRPILGE